VEDPARCSCGVGMPSAVLVNCDVRAKQERPSVHARGGVSGTAAPCARVWWYKTRATTCTADTHRDQAQAASRRCPSSWLQASKQHIRTTIFVNHVTTRWILIAGESQLNRRYLRINNHSLTILVLCTVDSLNKSPGSLPLKRSCSCTWTWSSPHKEKKRGSLSGNAQNTNTRREPSSCLPPPPPPANAHRHTAHWPLRPRLRRRRHRHLLQERPPASSHLPERPEIVNAPVRRRRRTGIPAGGGAVKEAPACLLPAEASRAVVLVSSGHGGL
jgi:hypothetical protein